jgi:hypothetical protein
LIALLNDPGRRDRMSAVGTERVRSTLAWEHQAPKLVNAYQRLLAPATARERDFTRDA